MTRPHVIEIKGFYARVSPRLPKSIEEAVDIACSYKPKDIERTNAYKDGWDGVIRLFQYGSFPAPLLNRVVFNLEFHQVPYRVLDHRRAPDPNPLPHGITLRPYQQEICTAAVELGSGLVQAPTGAGKTVMMLWILAHYGCKTLIIEPTIDLVHQVDAEAEKHFGGVGLGLIHQDQLDYDEEFCVGTWQTIYAKLTREPQPTVLQAKEIEDSGNCIEFEVKHKAWSLEQRRMIRYLKTIDLLLIDECHYYGSEATYEVARKCPAPRRFGFSATMWRTDAADLKFHACIGPMNRGITTSELIDLGWLVPPRIHFIEAPWMNARGTWAEVYKKAVVDNKLRNLMLVEQAIALVEDGRTVMMMVSQIRHGENLEAMLKEDGYDITFVHGKTKKKKRELITEEFRQGMMPLVISSSIWNIGVDFPIVSGIVMAGPFDSALVTVQRVGRGLRIHPGKKDVRVIETYDPYMYLQDHSMHRWQTYSEEPRFKVTGDFPAWMQGDDWE